MLHQQKQNLKYIQNNIWMIKLETKIDNVTCLTSADTNTY